MNYSSAINNYVYGQMAQTTNYAPLILLNFMQIGYEILHNSAKKLPHLLHKPYNFIVH